MADTRLGFVGTLPVGAWSNSTAYKYLDVVTYNGSSYVAKTETVPSGTLPTNTTYWQLMASKGDKGDTGEIISASATITDSFGTPTVVVTAGGTSTERTFAFAFSNLKGNGIEDIAETDYTGGVHTITVTESDGTTTDFEIHDGEVSQNALDTILEGYLPMDGYSESAGVGTADNLTTNTGLDDETPYSFRTTGGSADVGDRKEVHELVGYDIAWNQLCDCDNAELLSQASYNSTTHIFTLSYADGDTSSSNAIKFDNLPMINGHKYFALYKIVSVTDNAHIRFYHPSRSSAFNITSETIGDKFFTTGAIFEYATGNYDYIRVGKSSGSTLAQSIQMQFQLVDLTLAFGSAIADYAYNLETAQSGSGIKWLKDHGFFTKPYYAYQAGKLESVETDESITIGFNLFDKNAVVKGRVDNGVIGYADGTTSLSTTETGVTFTTNTRYRGFVSDYIRIPKGQTVYVNFKQNATEGNVCYVNYYDSELNWLGMGYAKASSFKDTNIPNECEYINISFQRTEVGSSTISDINVNLCWDDSRNGEWEQFVKRTYPFGHSVLHGILKIDANGNLYADGDVRRPDGTKEVNWGITNLGSLTWEYNTTSEGAPFFQATITGAVSTRTPQFVSDKYVYIKNPRQNLATSPDKSLAYWNNTNSAQVICIKDTAYTDADVFKTAVNGSYLLYMLATPTTDTADTFQETQIVSDFGTEYLTDYAYENGTRDVEIPVGHNTFYPYDLKAKLEMAPNSPDSSGDYIVRQTNGTNEYVAIGDNATIQSLLARVPQVPTEDGNYVLKTVVTGGVAVTQWVAE